MINGLRVKQAREICQLTQTELADKLKVHQSVIGKMETAIRNWPENVVHSLALITGFPVSFFTQGIGPEFPLGSLLFRCRVSLPANEKNKLRQLALLEFEIIEQLSKKIKPIELRLPSFNGESPIDAARVTRATLGLGPDTPIPHLINKLERNGVFVFAIPDADDKFDAFSLWSDTDPRRPVIVVNSSKPGDRLRFNCVHEIAHLVLHKSPRGNLNEMEKEADLFAAEFLLPEEAMRREVSVPVNLTDLAALKPRWGASIQSLIRRSFDLNLLTERQYRYMFEQISKLGWRKREPENLDIPVEKPRLFTKLAEVSYGVPVNIEKIAELVNAPVSMIEQLLSVHAGRSEMPKQQPSNIADLSDKKMVSEPKVLNFKNKKNIS